MALMRDENHLPFIISDLLATNKTIVKNEKGRINLLALSPKRRLLLNL